MAARPSRQNLGVTGADAAADAKDSTAQPRNNPFMSRWAHWYDYLVSLPPIRQIRRSEERTLRELYETTLRPTDTLLEIGPGTGRSTVQLAARVASVTAVEQSPEMLSVLLAKLASSRVHNCKTRLGDFMAMSFNEQFDVVALIGVLDYIADPGPFLQRAAALARRAILFTIPHQGILSAGFRVCNRLRRISVFPRTADEVCEYLPGFRVEIFETGLKTRLWRGMTLACRAVRA